MIIHAANSALCDQCQRFLLQSFVFFSPLVSTHIHFSHKHTFIFFYTHSYSFWTIKKCYCRCYCVRSQTLAHKTNGNGFHLYACDPKLFCNERKKKNHKFSNKVNSLQFNRICNKRLRRTKESTKCNYILVFLFVSSDQ